MRSAVLQRKAEMPRSRVELKRSGRLRPISAKQKARGPARSETRRLCMARAKGHCECGCGTVFGAGEATATMDHFFGCGEGRTKETAKTCWMLTRKCHRKKTDERPSRVHWRDLYIAHCERCGYVEEKELALNDRFFAETFHRLPFGKGAVRG